MNRLAITWVVRVSVLALLGCVRIPGQNAVPDCGSADDRAPARTELDDWLESLDRGPCAGPPKAMRPGVVSARSLAHKPTAKARQEFGRGMRARGKGRIAEAAQHFAEAARLDSEFVDAHTYAGLTYVKARQPSLALPHYQQAVQLEPANAALLSNLAGVLIGLHRWEEAEPAARKAVRLSPSSLEAHYMLGLALFGQGTMTEETAAHLRIAAEKYPLAHELLSQLTADPVRVSPETPGW